MSDLSKLPPLINQLNRLRGDHLWFRIEFNSYSNYQPNYPRKRLEVSGKEYKRVYQDFQGRSKPKTVEYDLEELQLGSKTLRILRGERVSFIYYHHRYHYSERRYPQRIVLTKYQRSNWVPYDDNQTTKSHIIETTFFITDQIQLILSRREEETLSYQVELRTELKDKINLTTLGRVRDQVSAVLYQTIYPYDLSEYRSLIKLFNTLGDNSAEKDPKSVEFNPGIVQTPRLLQYSDLVYGGLVNHPRSLFVVRHNVDGKRRFLIIHRNAIWIVNPFQNQVKRVTPDLPLNLENIFQRLDGVMIDGALVKSEQLRENPFGASEVFYVYDILNGNRIKYNQRPFLKVELADPRMRTPQPSRYDQKLIQSIGVLFRQIYRQSNYRLELSTIDLKFLIQDRYRDSDERRIEPFSLTIQEMIDLKRDLIYPTYGLTFIPVEKEYGNIEAEKRTLKKNLEAVEWKPNTLVKFYFRIGEDYQLLTRHQVPFQGSERYPLRESYYPQIQLDLVGKVARFQWNASEKRLFLDKEYLGAKEPDQWSEAQDKWRSLFEPIYLDTLLSNDNQIFLHTQFQTAERLVGSRVVGNHLLDLNSSPHQVYLWKRYFDRVIGLVTSSTRSEVEETVRTVYGYYPVVLTGLDYSQISGAKERKEILLVEQSAPSTPTQVGLLLQISSLYIEDRVDQILGFYLMESAPPQIYSTIRKMLKPGGKFHYLVLNRSNFDRILTAKMPQLQREGENFWTIDQSHSKSKGDQIVFNLDQLPEIRKLYPGNSIPSYRVDQLVLNLEKEGLQLIRDHRVDHPRSVDFHSYLLNSLFNYGTFRLPGETYRPPIISELSERGPKKLAYVMLLIKDDYYIPGILAAARSLQLNGSTIDRVCLVARDENITSSGIKLLEKSQLFSQIIRIDYLSSNISQLNRHRTDVYGEWMNLSFTKWQCLNLTQYDRILFLDADMIVTQNIDHLFDLPTPAACHNFHQEKRHPEEGIFNLRGDYPTQHGATISNDFIYRKLKIGVTFSASLILLTPNTEDYQGILRLLKELREEPEKIMETEEGPIKDPIKRMWWETTGKKIYGEEGITGTRNYVLKNLAGNDERALTYFYHQTYPKMNWINIHSRFNAVINSPQRLIKPSNIDTRSLARYYSPSVIHFIQSAKPWLTQKMKNRPDFVTIKIWYFLMANLLAEKVIQIQDLKGLLPEKRLGQLQKAISSEDYRQNFKYRYIPRLHRRLTPWLGNPDFNPFELKWKPGERPMTKKKWSYDPNTVFVINSINYENGIEPKPGRDTNEIIPMDRIKEFKPLEKEKNWRYFLFRAAERGGRVSKGEEAKLRRILLLTKDAVLAEFRDPTTDFFKVGSQFWRIMNLRNQYQTEKPKKEEYVWVEYIFQ